MKKLLFLYNPKAGKAGIVNCLSDIIDTFTKAGYLVTAYPTQCHGDGEQKVLQWAKDYDRIVCSGGDGTLDEIVTGIKDSGLELPIGYVPAGSTNDFARSLNLPSDMRQAAQVAVGNNTFTSDIGRFNDKYFVYVAAFGLFTDVTYETDQTLKNIFGYAAYMGEALKRLQSIKPIPLTVEYDGNVIKDNFLVGMISNSNSVGGMTLLPGPDVDLSDGLFEVLLIKSPDNILEFNSIPPAVLDRRIKSDCVITFKCSQINFSSDEPISWTLDGEYGGTVSNAVIHNLQGGMDFIVP